MPSSPHWLVLFLLSVIGYPVFGKQDIPMQDVVKRLAEFQEMAWGLQFEEHRRKSGDADLYSQKKFEISSDGQLARSWSKSHSNQSESWTYASNAGQWIFFANKSLNELSIEPSLHVTFLDAGQKAAGRLGLLVTGSTDHKLFTVIVANSKVSPVRREIQGIEYSGVVCREAGRGDIEFLFSPQMELTYITLEGKVGDRSGGTKFHPDSVTDQVSKVIYGPITYTKFFGRNLIHTVSCQVEIMDRIVSNVEFEFLNYEHLQSRLRSRIDLPEVDLRNGQEVFSSGQPNLRYEYWNGRVVKSE